MELASDSNKMAPEWMFTSCDIGWLVMVHCQHQVLQLTKLVPATFSQICTIMEQNYEQIQHLQYLAISSNIKQYLVPAKSQKLEMQFPKIKCD